MELKGRRVTVVGLGKSGTAACKLLLEKGASLSITDCQDNQKVRENIYSIQNKKGIAKLEIGRHTEDSIATADLVVTSPGVPAEALPLHWARKRRIPVIGEIELAFAFCPAPVIAITGTNGKTTVTTLVGQIFKAAGRKCVVCGNIGEPFSAKLPEITPGHTVILEVSSFQLETIERFKPRVAVILNISPDHLDRYASFDEYLATKSRIFLNQDEEDWSIFNADDPHSLSLARRTRGRVLFFSKNKYNQENFASFNHNHYAAATISSLFAIPEGIALNVCAHFRGLKHRLEEVAQLGRVRFINDSKATNVHSTLWALASIDGPVILIAGGKDKGGNFHLLREKLRDKVRAVVLLGEAKGKLKQAFADSVRIELTANLSQAVKVAFSLACPGDCILFSPMCASFDMFNDYAHRGRIFKQEVYNLINSPKASSITVQPKL